MLDDTSTMVLLLAGGRVHTSRAAARYLSMLDLGPGKDLYDHCMRVCPYYDTVIRARKKAVLDMCSRTIRERGTSQVVIFGAGMDALSVELASVHEGIRIFELDRANMAYKRSLLGSMGGEVGGIISCIGSDLCSPRDVEALLADHGWKHAEPTLLVFEGISYYMPHGLPVEIMSGLRSDGHQDYAILEYLLDEGRVSEDRRAIPDRIFGRISRMYGVQIAKYDRKVIRCRLGAAHGRVVETRDMAMMERDIDGHNTHFGKAGSGWIEVCLIAL